VACLLQRVLKGRLTPRDQQASITENHRNSSSTPAFTIPSLNWPIAATISLLGRTPASVFWSALTNSINHIVISPSDFGFGAGLPHSLDRLTPGSPDATNEGQRDRHGGQTFLQAALLKGSPTPRTPGGYRSLTISGAVRRPLAGLVAHQREREPALKAPRRSSMTRRSGQRPCRSARKRRSWSTASAPAHPRLAKRTAARPRPR
jgi:hypothetical protein